MRHGSLFSGIGGFDLAATWMGWENVFNCERDRFCRRVLKHYWPETKSYEDVRQFKATEYRGRIDVLSGGFPCQPFSVAGKREGTADDRYLWPQMLRIVGEIRPRWVVGENVFGLLNWNRGMVFRQVLIDLEAEGYEVWPYVLPAAGVGAPHRRDRIWFVAYAGRKPGDGRKGAEAGSVDHRKGAGRGEAANIAGGLCASGPVTDPDGNERGAGIAFNGQSGESPLTDGGDIDAADADGIERCEGRQHAVGSENAKLDIGARGSWDFRDAWKKFPTESPVCRRDDGLSTGLDGITFSSWRRESIKAYGNAIVPQVVLQIFRAIERMETVNSKQ